MVDSEDGPAQVTLRSGVFTIRQEPVVIPYLILEPRRIELRVAGCSAYADTIMDDLELWIRRMGGLHIDVPMSDFVLEEHSTLVARLGFTRTILDQIRFAVELKGVDYSLADYLMPVQPRVLSISPRPPLDSAGQVYECQAPLSTDRHIAYLTELEEALSK